MQERTHRANPRQASLSRRRLAGQAILSGVALSGLAFLGCDSRKSSTTTPGGRAGAPLVPKRGGTLNVSFNFKQKFDPHVLPADQTQMMGLFYQTLVRNAPNTYALEPELAAKWEIPSQTELLFTLAPNIRWHDKPPVNGRAFNADDVVFNYRRVLTNDPKFISKAALASVDKMEAVDSRTVKLTLKQPSAVQLVNLTDSGLRMLAPEAVEAAKGNLSSAETVVGTGAFVLQRTEENVGSSLVRNANYFKAGLPYVDRIEVRAFQDDQSEWAAFLAGKLDHRAVPGQESKQFAQEKKDKYTLEWFADPGHYIAMAMTLKKPFDDPRVTRALRLLMDHAEYKSAWADVWYGRSRYSPVFSAATSDVWDLTESEYAQHLEWKQPKDDANKEALSLLAAAGFTKDKPLKFTLSGTSLDEVLSSAAQLAQAQFKRNSQGVVDPSLLLFEIAAWTAVRAQGNFEYYVAGHAPSGYDPDPWLSATYQTGGSRNYGKMTDPQLDQMIDKQRTIFDEKQRKQAIREILLYLIDHSPYGGPEAFYVLNATEPNTKAFPAESRGVNNGYKWADHYENIWIDR
jgi:peptide/nickel transport system substrate-binding protein